jgi:hypothetical protein
MAESDSVVTWRGIFWVVRESGLGVSGDQYFGVVDIYRVMRKVKSAQRNTARVRVCHSVLDYPRWSDFLFLLFLRFLRIPFLSHLSVSAARLERARARNLQCLLPPFIKSFLFRRSE